MGSRGHASFGPRALLVALATANVRCTEHEPAPVVMQAPTPERPTRTEITAQVKEVPFKPRPVCDPLVELSGDVTERRGRLDIARIATTRPGVSRATLEQAPGDDSLWLPGIHDDPRYFPFVERQVVARGKQRYSGRFSRVSFFDVLSVCLAEGEQPNADVEHGLPTPLPLRTRADLQRREHRWFHAFGEVARVSGRGDLLTRVWVRLDVGPQVRATAVFKGEVGDRVTVLGRLRRDDDGHWIAARASVCRGEEPRCGMSHTDPAELLERRLDELARAAGHTSGHRPRP